MPADRVPMKIGFAGEPESIGGPIDASPTGSWVEQVTL